ncbi:hypothetical protein [Brucella intermedia]|uniref:hypothetical protein n=1 Tax=Brucella intermedia TaxID=94625 RepID=UPI00159175C8|nr:hypothetical protein [Brucella intermedia]
MIEIELCERVTVFDPLGETCPVHPHDGLVRTTDMRKFDIHADEEEFEFSHPEHVL